MNHEDGLETPQQRRDRADHLERYSEHARRLQTWIGAYGAGLATLLIYQFRTAADEATARIKAAVLADPSFVDSVIDFQLNSMRDGLILSLKFIAAAFVSQVVLLVLNKWTQVTLANDASHSQTFKAANKVSDWYSIDFVLDAASLSLLAAATLVGLDALGLLPKVR